MADHHPITHIALPASGLSSHGIDGLDAMNPDPFWRSLVGNGQFR